MTRVIEHSPPEGMSLADNWADVVSAHARFADHMIEKFTNVQHKGHWRYVDFTYLLDRIDQELEELHKALEAHDLEGAAEECVDVANCTMMLADWLRERAMQGGEGE